MAEWLQYYLICSKQNQKPAELNHISPKTVKRILKNYRRPLARLLPRAPDFLEVRFSRLTPNW
jgi:hypothetical protein